MRQPMEAARRQIASGSSPRPQAQPDVDELLKFIGRGGNAVPRAQIRFIIAAQIDR
jgi:hypothetical protein